jgi:hypothetical protein
MAGSEVYVTDDITDIWTNDLSTGLMCIEGNRHKLLYAFFWVIPQCLNFTCQSFGTLCLFHLHRRIGMKYPSYLPAYEDGTVF